MGEPIIIDGDKFEALVHALNGDEAAAWKSMATALQARCQELERALIKSEPDCYRCGGRFVHQGPEQPWECKCGEPITDPAAISRAKGG